jgi:uncharacterized protein YndB with AHSA1/START domain
LHIEHEEELAMPDIRHRVGIKAPIGEVYDAIATRDGVARWWTRDVEGESRPGGSLAFGFGSPEPSAVMEVTELVPSTRASWQCINGPDDWVDTTVTFELNADGEETVVMFTHAGWQAPVDFMHHCSTKWAYFLIGLKDGFEGGKATPWPDDAPVSSWG